MNHHQLIPAAPAALLFAGAFSAFSSSTALPGPTGAAHALTYGQPNSIASASPRASEPASETEDDPLLLLVTVDTVDTVCCPILEAVTSCSIEGQGEELGYDTATVC